MEKLASGNQHLPILHKDFADGNASFFGCYCTLPKTNIEPKKWWFPIGISFSRGSFSGAMLVSGRYSPVDINFHPHWFFDLTESWMDDLITTPFPTPWKLTALTPWKLVAGRWNFFLGWSFLGNLVIFRMVCFMCSIRLQGWWHRYVASGFATSFCVTSSIVIVAVITIVHRVITTLN